VSEPADGKSAKKPRALRKARFATDADLEIKGAYGPADIADLDVPRDLGQPGQRCTAASSGRCASTPASAPRPRTPTAATSTCWPRADGPVGGLRPADADGLRLRSPAVAGEVGRVGVAIDSLDDMRVLFDGIPLGEVSTSMTINATAATLLALYVAVGDEQGVLRRKLRGTIQNDILKEYIAQKEYISRRARRCG
jgi:methylmalonyl-CoA mutase N-terminal domain/subunit